MAQLIVRLITWGIIFLSAGTLGEISLQVMNLAAKSSQSGLVSLTKLNSDLQTPKSK